MGRLDTPPRVGLLNFPARPLLPGGIFAENLPRGWAFKERVMKMCTIQFSKLQVLVQVTQRV